MIRTKSVQGIQLFFAFIIMLLSACTSSQETVKLSVTASEPQTTPTPTQSAPTASPSPTAVPSIPAPSLYISPDLPETFLSKIHLPDGILTVNQKDGADVTLEVQSGQTISTWVYAVAAPFPTIQDEITLKELTDLWQNDQTDLTLPTHLLVDDETLVVFEKLWGQPSAHIRRIPQDQLLQQAWQNRSDWAILPFEQLEPRWKVIAVDGQNPLHKDFDPNAYPLAIHFGLSGDAALIEQLVNDSNGQSENPAFPSTNRRSDRLTTVVVTGVTALVRGTAAYMEQFGMDYPAKDILPWLRDADILHISNEIAFAENCPSPNNWEGLAFCSQPRYIQLLDDIGTDVIDLAGDHFADWGPEAMYFTLNLYRERGWKVYGGGENSDQAKQPALFDHNGNKIAFLGCNYKNPAYSTATEKSPGAIHCDPAWLEPAISRVKSQGYLPIVTFQHEEYYEYTARPLLEKDFRAAAQAGAVIVSGSQAHQPQALEFDGQSLLHYGLGNLFFDQVYSMDATRTAFIDRHVFYEGRYINTELLTIEFVDYARSRPMTEAERQELLKVVFSASVWGVESQVK